MRDKAFKCLYCGEEKPLSKSSKEHAIPQFLGGNSAPQFFQLNNVCEKCNNDLGLWVDASFAKSQLIINYFAKIATLLCAKLTDPGLPLKCTGKAQNILLKKPDNYVAEHWLGPSGETIIWIRPHDEKVDSYAGGNPIETKKKNSVAYFFPVGNQKKFILGIRSFHHFFEKKKKLRKILCAKVIDPSGEVNPKSLKFDAPINEDKFNEKNIRQVITNGEIYGQFSLDKKFDFRFACKLATGVGYALFGNDFLDCGCASEAQKGIWYRSENNEKPNILGQNTTFNKDNPLATTFGYTAAVVITVHIIEHLWILNFTINQEIQFFVALGPESMTSQHIEKKNDGYVLLLFPYLNKSIEMTYADFKKHKDGTKKNPELEVIDERLKAASEFNFQIASSPNT